MATTPITELNNELSTDLEAEDALGFVRTLRAVDAQIWSGYKAHPGLLDAGPLRRANEAADLAALALRGGGVVALTGCGTSGRVAHLVARRHERLARSRQPGPKRSFDYLIAGGDAALLLSDELPEDDGRADEARAAGEGGRAGTEERAEGKDERLELMDRELVRRVHGDVDERSAHVADHEGRDELEGG